MRCFPKNLDPYVLPAVLIVALLATPAIAGEGDDDHHHLGPALQRLSELDFSAFDFGDLDCDKLEASEHGGAFQRVQRGFLGVELTRITPELRRHFGAPEDEGVMLGKVIDDSAAFREGLQVGDIITRIDGETVRDAGDLSSVVHENGGETVAVEVWRDGSVRSLNVTLEERESCTFDIGAMGVDFEAIQIDAMQITEEAMEQVREALEGVDWQEHMERIHELQGEEFNERMEGLQRRMEELQRHLESEYDTYGEELQRALEAKERALEKQRRALEERQNLSEAERKQHRELMRREMEQAREETRAAMKQRRDAVEAERRAAEAQREAAMKAAEAERRAAEQAAAEAARAAEAEAGGGTI